MENVDDNLGMVKKRVEIANNLHDKFQSGFSTLKFSFQSKEVEFQDVMAFLLEQAKLLVLEGKRSEEVAKQLACWSKEVEVKSQRVEEHLSKVKARESEKDAVEKCMQETKLELDFKGAELELLRNCVNDCDRELCEKKWQLGLVQKELVETNGEVNAKKQQLGGIQNSIEGYKMELKTQEEEVNKVMSSLESCNSELKVKREELNEVKDSIIVLNNNIEVRKTVLETLQARMNECARELDLKAVELDSVQKSLDLCMNTLELKKNKHEVTIYSLKQHGQKKTELNGVEELLEKNSKELASKLSHLDSIEELIKENMEEITEKEKVYNSIKDSINQLSAKRCLEEQELCRLHGSIKERSTDLDSINSQIKEKTLQYEVMQRQCEDMQESVSAVSSRLKSKESEVKLLEKSIEECLFMRGLEEKKLQGVQKGIKLYEKVLERKKKNLRSLRKRAAKYCQKLELKVRELGAVHASIIERNEQLVVKENQLKSIQSSIQECSEELRAKKEQEYSVKKFLVECPNALVSRQKDLKLVNKSVEECHEKLKLKEIELESAEELKEREKRLDSLTNALERQSEELEIKETEFEQRRKEFGFKEKQLEEMQKLLQERSKEVELEKKKLEQHCCELGLKEKQLQELQKSLQECSKQFELDKKEFERHHLEFGLNKQKSLLERPKDVECKMKQPSDAIKFREAAGKVEKWINSCLVDPHHLWLVLNEDLGMHDFVVGEVFKALERSNDPAALVLKTMKQFYSPILAKGKHFDLNSTRSCITLLEQLMRISPKIKPEVSKEARKLSSKWKAKVSVVRGDSLEVLVLLKHLAAFQLPPNFIADELQSLLGTNSKHFHLLETLQALGIAPSLLGSQIPSSQVKIEQMEDFLVSHPDNPSSANLTSDERSFESIVNEGIGNKGLTAQKISERFLRWPNLAARVLDFFNQAGFPVDEARTRFLIMEQVVELCPQASPGLKEKSIPLAVQWEKVIGRVNENPMEVLAFLLFLVVYRPAPYLRNNKVLELIGNIAQYKRAPDISRVLGFTDEMPGFIRMLIQRRKHLEAARFICSFGLVDEFPLEPLLTRYLEETRMEALSSRHEMHQDWTIDKEVDALKAILNFSAEYKLNLGVVTKSMHRSIVFLENEKVCRRRYARDYLSVQRQLPYPVQWHANKRSRTGEGSFNHLSP